MTIRVLSSADIERALDPARSVDAMRVAFAALSGGRATVPVRGQLESAAGTTLLMPAYLAPDPGARPPARHAQHGDALHGEAPARRQGGGSGEAEAGGHDADLLGVKIVSVFPGNAARGEPTVQGVVLLLDASTGASRALIDGTRLTEIRTAAASALATELLADPVADVLAVFGAGAQARAHVELLAGVRRLAEVRIVSRSGTSAERLAAALAERAGDFALPGAPRPVIRAVADPAEALADAGIVVAATTSTTPVFDDADLGEGAHVNAVGSYRPDMQELPPELVARARVVVDQREAVWEEAGDLIVPLDEGRVSRDVIDAELGEIVLGEAPPGRGGWPATVFKSVGNAAQDVAIAAAAVARAEALGLGATVPF